MWGWKSSMRFSVRTGKGRKTPIQLRKFTHMHSCGVYRKYNAYSWYSSPWIRCSDQIFYFYFFLALTESVRCLILKEHLPFPDVYMLLLWKQKNNNLSIQPSLLNIYYLQALWWIQGYGRQDCSQGAHTEYEDKIDFSKTYCLSLRSWTTHISAIISPPPHDIYIQLKSWCLIDCRASFMSMQPLPLHGAPLRRAPCLN